MRKNEDIKTFIKAQRFEETEYEIFKKLIKITKDEKNRQTLDSLARGSKKHAQYWSEITGVKLGPSRIKIFVYTFLFRVFGLTFGIKLMESDERKAERIMEGVIRKYPKYKWILEEEKIHEQKLIELINEDFLNYVSSVVLGSNDSIVSTVGTAAGLSVALSNVHLIGMTSLISGATAALSMSASSYLSSLSEKSKRKPLIAGIYTGITYILTVVVLIIPYYVTEDHYIALFVTSLIATIVITGISFYISVIQGTSFFRRFFQNIALSFGIAIISFVIGYFINKFFGLSV